jgi:hypothetical protein
VVYTTFGHFTTPSKMELDSKTLLFRSSLAFVAILLGGGFGLLMAWRKGAIYLFARRAARFTRDRDPISFWFTMAIYGVAIFLGTTIAGGDIFKALREIAAQHN